MESEFERSRCDLFVFLRADNVAMMTFLCWYHLSFIVIIIIIGLSRLRGLLTSLSLVSFSLHFTVYKRRNDGIHVINLGKTWDKLMMAARIIVATENPADVICQSARPYGQRAVLKFAQYTGAKAIAGRHMPGTYTNQIDSEFREPRVVIMTDPRTDSQPISETAYVNLPVIALSLIHI